MPFGTFFPDTWMIDVEDSWVLLSPSNALRSRPLTFPALDHVKLSQTSDHFHQSCTGTGECNIFIATGFQNVNVTP